MRIRLDDDIEDSDRAGMDIRPKQVDHRYHTMPLGELIRTFGHKWIEDQQAIFDEVLTTKEEE